MKKYTKVLIGLTGLILVLGVGSVSATYAWFQLQQDKNFFISGTSFGSEANLQIGFASEVDLNNEYLIYDEEDSLLEGKKIYYFNGANDGENIIVEPSATKYYLEANGYSNGVVYPITTGKYVKGDKVNYYRAPYVNSDFETYKLEAEKGNYVHLSIVLKTDAFNEIFFRDFSMSAGKAKDAMRVRMKSVNVEGVDTITKPSAKEPGTTIVGGPLDLDADGQYDHYKVGGEDVEHFYGQKKEGSELIYGEPYSESVTTQSDFNYNCFINPNKQKGVKPLKDVESYAEVANYENITKYFSNNITSESTSAFNIFVVADENGIAIIDFDLYIEGWDKASINEIIGESIGASFTFMVRNTHRSW